MSRIIDAKVDSRSTQEECKFHDDSGWDTKARSESGSIGNQQERINRENSPRSNFFGDRSSVIGGILRQLINEYTNQVAHKKAEIVQLESRIEEFNSLLEQLEADEKT